MNSKKYPVINYVPTKVTTETEKDLDLILKQITYDTILNDVDYHFENCYITNFDLIHDECRGDKLNFSRRFYQTISLNELNKNTLSPNQRQKFISSAIKSERSDLYIEKKLLKEHFNRDEIEKTLGKDNIFLSNMRKIFFAIKNTDYCKSLDY